jgi:hypothetical protein
MNGITHLALQPVPVHSVIVGKAEARTGGVTCLYQAARKRFP